jgi:glutathione S-transferase
VLRLVTIPISHYCEKARWALERAALAYREERHVQGVHRIAARRAGGSWTVPVLVTPERTIGSSIEILRWVDERTPAASRLFENGSRANGQAQLCERLDTALGPAGRRLMYVLMLEERELALRYNNQGIPRWEDLASRHGWRLIQGFVRRSLGIRPGVQAQDEAVVRSELDHVASLLADGRPYLAGERFGAADLTFASMAAAVVFPPAYGVPLPQPADLPPRVAAHVERARDHPAGRHALMLFADHRSERVA